VKRVTYLLYLAAASAAAADDSEMMASQEVAAPARMPCHHDLAPVNGITFHDFWKTENASNHNISTAPQEVT